MLDCQRLLLRGSEASAEYLTSLLRRVKDRGGISTGNSIIAAFKEWESSSSTPVECHAKSRSGASTILQLPLFCSSSKEQTDLNTSIEQLKRDLRLRTILRKAGVSREQWLLEALILVLETFEGSTSLARYQTIESADGVRCKKHIFNYNKETIVLDEIKVNLSTMDRRGSSLAVELGLLRNRERRMSLLKDNEQRILMRRSSADVSSTLPTKKGWRLLVNEMNRKPSIDARNVNSKTFLSRADKRKKTDSPSETRANKKLSTIRSKYNLEDKTVPVLTSKERREKAAELSYYLSVIPPEERDLPGFSGKQGKWDRQRHGVDCDEVFPGILLGNGATVKNREYLERVGVSHILNAAEFRGVNVGKEFYENFSYKGIRVEDTPQTQICRHFVDVAEYMDSALLSETGKLFVNCVFGRSRSATCVAAYLMLKHDWDAMQALRHIRKFRPVQVNDGFIQQLADLDYKLNWLRKQRLDRGSRQIM